jgi:hypothetical protein
VCRNIGETKRVSRDIGNCDDTMLSLMLFGQRRRRREKRMKKSACFGQNVENCNRRKEEEKESKKKIKLQGRGLPLAQRRVSRAISTYETKM